MKILYFVVFMMVLSNTAFAQNAALPITIDYPLLNSLVEARLFKKAEKEVELVKDPMGCKKVYISDPELTREGARLRFELKLRIIAGVEANNDCYLPVEWEGYVVFYQTPLIDPETFRLSFRTEDSRVLNKKREPGIISGPLWNLVKEKVHTQVDGIRIDLIPCVNEMKAFLAVMFPQSNLDKVVTMVESMKPGKVEVQDKAMRIAMNVDVSSVYDETRKKKEEPLSEEELSGFIDTWQSMDAFIVYALGSLAGKSLSADDKQKVFETLLDTRYRFLEELDKPAKENDFVRTQFVEAWNNLSFLFRHHMGKTASPMGTLAFFSSLDALKALDALGPAMGIEISRDGLLRMARLISDGQGTGADLSYSFAVDKNLRKVMGFGAALKESPEDIEEEPDQEKDFLHRILNRLISAVSKIIRISPYSEAIAAEKKKPEREDPAKWLPDTENIDKYVEKVKQELKTAADQTVIKKTPDPEFRDLFYLIVHAVAWQESCFRQFKKEKGVIEYLRSYNNTSVGLMQINEKVWRGMYDPEKIKWNIRYNMAAGCEIVDLYLQTYILKKMAEKKYPALQNKDNLARTLYALYNGGPGEFSKFLERLAKKKFYTSDDLFNEKYLWVKNEQWEKAGICLVGE
ncbi:MAG: lytic transglycosylase domain-containing protein [Desulfobacula sp.]